MAGVGKRLPEFMELVQLLLGGGLWLKRQEQIEFPEYQKEAEQPNQRKARQTPEIAHYAKTPSKKVFR